MTRFVFRLQSVLRLRESEEQALLRSLAELQRRRDAARTRLELLKASAAEASRRGALRRLSSTDPLAESRLQHYLAALQDAVRDQTYTLHLAQEAVDARLADVMEARKARKSLERLREIQCEEHTRLEASEEMKALDEVAALRFTHAPS